MGTMRTRTRINGTEEGTDTFRVSSSTGGIASSHKYKFVSRQTTTDEQTLWHERNLALRGKNLTAQQRHAIRRQDYGGEFTSTSSSVENRSPVYQVPCPPYWFTGRIFAKAQLADFNESTQKGLWGPSIGQVDSDLFKAGGQAVARCAPVKPQASLFQALGELYRDGLPSIPGAKVRKNPTLSEFGGEYLNVVFGIQPLVSDLMKLAESVKRADKLLKQYMRDSGRMVRRSYEFPLEHSVTTVVEATNSPPRPSITNIYSAYGDRHKTEVLTTKTWFSGAFTYYVDEKSMGGLSAEVQKANYLYGVLPTPGVLYDLMPWSWAIDWFINLGDVLNNLSMTMSDGLVMPYGYVMREVSRQTTYHYVGTRLANGVVPESAQTLTLKGKYRRRASIFGFGFDLEDLTPRQAAIVAALGLSRGGGRVAF